jgi:hypothetical protein
MRPHLIAFALGFLALGVAAFAVVLAVGIGTDLSGSAASRLALGPLVFLETERSAAGSSLTLGPGILLVAVAGGVANALTAALIRARR